MLAMLPGYNRVDSKSISRVFSGSQNGAGPINSVLADSFLATCGKSVQASTEAFERGISIRLGVMGSRHQKNLSSIFCMG